MEGVGGKYGGGGREVWRGWEGSMEGVGGKYVQYLFIFIFIYLIGKTKLHWRFFLHLEIKTLKNSKPHSFKKKLLNDKQIF